jgi:DNA-binding transcriptional regulator YiaG
VELTASVPVRICDECGFHFTDEAADDARHEAICRHLRVMTPQEIATVRKDYGLSRPEFARLTRLGEASLARWEAGLLIQNAAYDQFLYLLTFPENIERLKQRNREAVVKTIPHRIVKRVETDTGLRVLREIPPDLRARAAAFQLCPTGT